MKAREVMGNTENLKVNTQGFEEERSFKS